MSASSRSSVEPRSWLVCSICLKSFSRLEHRLRHENAHAGEKPYECNYCGRTFARKDSAKRHESGHGQFSSSQPASSVTLRGSCSSCNRFHVKCSGGEPCASCATKNLVCIYEKRKTKRSIYKQPERLRRSTNRGEESASHGDNAPIPPNFETAVCPLQVDSGMVRIPAISPSSPRELPAEQHNLPLGTSCLNEEHISVTHSVSSTQDPHFRSLSLMETNWLAFDQSSTSDLTSPISGNQPSRAFDPSSLIATTENDFNDNQEFSMDSETALSRNDRVSALITSMRAGLPGVFSNPDGDRLTGDSKEMGLVSRYSDGAGARASQSDRCILERQENHAIHDEMFGRSGDSVSPWISILEGNLRKSTFRKDFTIPNDVWEEVFARVSREWTVTQFPPPLNDYKQILSGKDILEYFIQLYFENFHNVYPFLDRSFLCISAWGWSLCIAAAGIGSRYLCVPEITLFGDGLCSLLHQILFEELAFGHIEDSLPFIQARALTAIGLCHSRQSSFVNCGYNAAALLFNSCLRLRLLEEDNRIGAFQSDQDVEQVWIAWRFRETRRRTGFFIHLTDSLLAFMTRTSPRLPLKLLKLMVPCTDNLWEADTCQKWFMARVESNDYTFTSLDFHEEEHSRSQIQDVLRKVWTDLKPPGSLSEYGTTSLIHILLRRIWDSPWYSDKLKDPWAQDPVQGDNGSLDVDTRSVFYPAVVPEFSKWRNGVCDCLDVLHWEALSLSAKVGGLEGPIFLQLHLARLLLLTPITQLFSHIQECQGLGSKLLLPHQLFDVPDPDPACRQTIAVWATRDRHKARLAVVHAGAIFWHVRRYSSDSFVRSFSIFLAAITLWAYGRFAQKSFPLAVGGDPSSALARGPETPNLTGTGISPAESSTSTSMNNASFPSMNSTASLSIHASVPNSRRMPNFMQLDRPMDDELVQHFIRAGDGMILHLEGVEDLCSDQGSKQVLQEAIVILNDFKDIWPISENYAMCLQGVVG